MPAPRPPSNSMKRYSGNLMAAVRLVEEGLRRIKGYDDVYRAKPTTSYPNQFATAADMAVIAAARVVVDAWIVAKGPIPNRS